MDRSILHVDLNNCYASIEMLYDPTLRGIPLVVGGDEELRHGIVLAKSYEAKAYGIKTGESLLEARQKCPNLKVVPPHFDLYWKMCMRARAIYQEYTDQVEPFGIDEAWLDVTGSQNLYGPGASIADEIRDRVKSELGLTVSVGVSFNKVFAKLGSDMKKPDAVTVLTRGNFREKISPLPASDLLYVGRATAAKLARLGVRTIGDMMRIPLELYEQKFGKVGGYLWGYVHGMEASPVACVGDTVPVKGIGNGITAPRDLISHDDFAVVYYVLAESVCERLREQGFLCKTVQVMVRDSAFITYQKQRTLEEPTCLSSIVSRTALELTDQCVPPSRHIRSLTIHTTNLIPSSGYQQQFSLFEDSEKEQNKIALERTVDDLRRRFGRGIIKRGIVLDNQDIGNFDPRQHIIHPVGFLNGKN